ncbi:hypothetical protein [Providencia stuartii]|uniref:hypothetical protein n=1 Tax=Providencia stuartii TaxID=588 RepID=UPI000DE64DE3|nr:hypothetical protein [Providencia stuartii]MDQ5989773.1 hypothetical protein [Providencia stuartii]MDT7048762.1 hypothetical protein [Providencia stuartii]SST02762.1 Uncharacterised protein [Acinetobacter baumannii]
MLKVIYITGSLKKRLVVSATLFKCAFAALFGVYSIKAVMYGLKEKEDKEQYQKIESLCDVIAKRDDVKLTYRDWK